MQIILNGENIEILEDKFSIMDLIEKYDLSPKKVAVERNLEIVASESFAETILADGDKIELVEFVGGG